MNRTFLTVALAIALVTASGSPSSESLRFAPLKPDVVAARLERYRGDNSQREQTLKSIFAEAGCGEGHLSEQQVQGAGQPNVICILPGKTNHTVIVGAHFDRVSEGDGVVDNWTGASLLPSLYQSLKSEPRRHTYVFVGFSAEEAGLVGSHFFVHQMSADTISVTDAMVNMDTLGLGPTRVWASHSDKTLVGALAYVAKQLQLPLTSVNVDQIGSSDSEEFAAKRIPAITVHSLTEEAWNAHILHTSKDSMAWVRPRDYYETYRLLVAYLTFLDQLSLGRGSGSN